MIETWFPKHKAIYDINISYEENLRQGPQFQGEIPSRNLPPKEKWPNFLGYKVASKLGVAAGPLLDSRWTSFASDMGFDIITYKTIRSQKHLCHPHPNCQYVDLKNPLDPNNIPLKTKLAKEFPKVMSDISITNSFGMPSQEQKVLLEDLPRAINYIAPHQILVVSVVGTPSKDTSFVDDFVNTALFAKSCGAKIIEANFSCPNVVSKEGSLFLDPKLAYDMAKALTAALKGTPLIIKVGAYQNLDLMRKMFIALSKAGVAAVSGINTVSMQVVDDHGNPALGPTRLKSGICGRAIFNVAQDFIRNGRSIIDSEKLDLTLIGVGGVTTSNDFHTFDECGADFMQCATAMMWDPYIAMRYHQINS